MTGEELRGDHSFGLVLGRDADKRIDCGLELPADLFGIGTPPQGVHYLLGENVVPVVRS